MFKKLKLYLKIRLNP